MQLTMLVKEDILDKIIDFPRQLKLPLQWYEDVWLWGNPLTKQSYQAFFDSFVEYRVMSTVVVRNFWRTFRFWQQKCGQHGISRDDIEIIIGYEREAKEQNIKNVQEYIAVRIGKDQSTVSRILQLIDFEEALEVVPDWDGEVTNFAYDGESVGFIGSRAQSTYTPSRKQINRKIKSMRVECAAYGLEGCQQWTPDGSKALCWHCHSEYAIKNKGTLPAWLQDMVNRSKSDVYERAVNALYEDHYGSISIEQYEAVAEAA